MPRGHCARSQPAARPDAARAPPRAGSSFTELARASGLSKTILGRIEAGDGNPSIETLWRISQALALPLGALLEDEGRPNARVIRARSGEQVRAESGMTGWLVHADGRDHRTELYDLEYPRARSIAATPTSRGRRRSSSAWRDASGSARWARRPSSGPGDAILFAADAPHSYEALRDTRVLCWMLYAPRHMRRRSDLVAPVLAGCVTALVGFSGSFPVVLAGLRAVGADREEAASGLLAALRRRRRRRDPA